MDTKKLDALLAAAKLGSLSRAAEQLGYTQSGLGYMIDSLESELGCRLMHRDHRGVRLSAEGEQLLPYLRRAAAANHTLAEHAKALAQNGLHIRIGAFASIAYSWLPNIIAGFTALHPDVSADIRVQTDELRRWLDDGSVELAFVDATTARGFEWIPLRREPLLAAVPRDYPVTEGAISVQRLLQSPFIRSADEDLDRILPRQPERDYIRIDSVDDGVIASMVSHGLGVSILPELSFLRFADDIRALPLDPPCYRELGIAVKSMRAAAPMTRRFINYCKKAEY